MSLPPLNSISHEEAQHYSLLPLWHKRFLKSLAMISSSASFLEVIGTRRNALAYRVGTSDFE